MIITGYHQKNLIDILGSPFILKNEKSSDVVIIPIWIDIYFTMPLFLHKPMDKIEILGTL